MRNARFQAGAGPTDAFATVAPATGHLSRGFTLVEVLITLAIFSILMSVAFSAYQSQLRTATREYSVAADEMDLLVARNIIARDLELGGFGLADDYSALSSPPPNTPYRGTNGSTGPDTLLIRGTALGLNSRATQGWSYVTSTSTFANWGDASEDLRFGTSKDTSDSFILLEPTSRRLQTFTSGSNVYWRFYYNSSTAKRFGLLASVTDAEVTDTWQQGMLLYGLVGADKTNADVTQPYWAVRYYLKDDANPEDKCASGARRLLRAESLAEPTTPASGEAIATCVLDFQVAFGVDTDEDGSINLWDNGGATNFNALSSTLVKKRLKQVRVYMLVQAGGGDPDGYTYPSATVRVGDAVAGRDLTLTDAQRKYHWKLLTVSVTPRNMR